MKSVKAIQAMASKMAQETGTSLYMPEYCPIVKESASRGLSLTECGKVIGVTAGVLNTWIKKHDELAQAYAEGREIMISTIENALFRRAVGYDVDELTEYSDAEGNITGRQMRTKHVPPSPPAIVFFLSNKGTGWDNRKTDPRQNNTDGFLDEETASIASKMPIEQLREVNENIANFKAERDARNKKSAS
jgi:hypothetical protein